MPQKKNVESIEQIVADQAPNVQVVRRRRSTTSVTLQPDAKLPRMSRCTPAELEADSLPGAVNDDVVLVNVQPKSSTNRSDDRAPKDQVLVVSKSKKKILARRG